MLAVMTAERWLWGAAPLLAIPIPTHGKCGPLNAPPLQPAQPTTGAVPLIAPQQMMTMRTISIGREASMMCVRIRLLEGAVGWMATRWVLTLSQRSDAIISSIPLTPHQQLGLTQSGTIRAPHERKTAPKWTRPIEVKRVRAILPFPMSPLPAVILMDTNTRRRMQQSCLIQVCLISWLHDVFHFLHP